MKDLKDIKTKTVGTLLVSQKTIWGEVRYRPENATAKAFLQLQRNGNETFDGSLLSFIESQLNYEVKTIVPNSPFNGDH